MAYRSRPGETQHQARERIAKAKGFSSYRAYRQSSAQTRERASRALAARDRDYGRTLDQSTAAIRRRAGSKIYGPHGVTLTSTSYRRQYAHVRGADQDGLTRIYAVVRIANVDRRRRDARRARGRDSGYRTLDFTVPTEQLDADDGLDAFADALDSTIDAELERLYIGGGGDWSISQLALTVSS